MTQRSAAPVHPAVSMAAGALSFAVVAALIAKGVRAAELALDTRSAAALLVFPAVIWIDVACAAGLALLAWLSVRVLGARAGRIVGIFVLIPLTLLLPADIVTQRLIGGPVTWARMLGNEGGTAANWNLLKASDLIWTLGGFALTVLILVLSLRYAQRSALLRKLAQPWTLLFVLLVSTGLSVACDQFVARDFGLGEEPMVTFVLSVFDNSGVGSTRLNQSGWAKLLEPDARDAQRPKPPRTTGAHAKNAVIFLAEGVPFKHTSFGPDKEKPTPFLAQRYARDGMLFDRYYATWHSSIQALFSIACSQFPPLTGNIVRIKPRIDCGELSETFARLGYHVGLFHGGRFSFYSKLAFLGTRRYEAEIDAEELARTRGAKVDKWGTDDRIMVDAVVDWVSSLPKDEPFIAVVIPISPHYPYTVPSDVKKKIPGNDERARFLNGVMFQDLAFERMLKGFEKRGLYDDTLFAWLGDHGNSVNEPLRDSAGKRGTYQANVHTPLVLLNRRMFAPGTVSNRVGSHLDLVPTLLDALGQKPEPKRRGQSLLSDAYRPRRVFIGAPGKLGFVQGSEKLVRDFRSKRNELYDLVKDPDELHNLVDEIPKRVLKQRLADIDAFAQAVNGYFEQAPVLKETVSVSTLFPLAHKNAQMSLVDAAGKSQACTKKSESLQTCGERELRLEVTSSYAQRRQRKCLMVSAPKLGETVRVTLRDPVVLGLLSGSLVALPKGVNGTFSISTEVDGTQRPGAKLTPAQAERVEYPKAKRELSFMIKTTVAPASPDALVCLALIET